MGDSAGGGLAVALMAQLGAQDVAPRAAGLMSPWLDLTATALSRGVDDPFISEGDLKARARLYAAGRDPTDPRLSPLLGELKGLPPMIVHVGSREVLLNDAARFARAANAAGSFVELEVWDRMTHVWHQWGAALPAAGIATTSLAERVVELAGWTNVRSETAP